MQKRIQQDMFSAMKENNEIKKDTLRMIISDLKYEKIKTQKDLTDDDVIKVIKRGIKSRQESIELFKQGNRNDLVEKTKIEISILEPYLPKQLSQEEIEKIISGIISELGITDIKDTGRAMKEIMSRHTGKIDGKIAQQILSAKLKK